MTYDSQKYHRRSIRLKGYDYSQAGAYFITVCVQDRACLFGDVVGDEMHLNDAGRIALAEWNAMPGRFPGVELDAFVLMPNHIHGIIVMETAGVVARSGATTRVAPTQNANMAPVMVPADRAAAKQATADVEPSALSEQAPVGATLVVALAPPATTVGKCESAAVARPWATTRVTPTPALATSAPAASSAVPTVGDVVGAFKSLTTVLYIHGVKQSGWPAFRGRLWQRNFHEHIIRNEESLNRIRQYILDNPACWESDEENPQVERPVRKKA